MRIFSLCVLLGAPVALAGCGASRPLTDSEFRGFCYTAIGHRTSCDTITICNEYDSDVLSAKHGSLQDCANGCQTVYNRIYGPNQFNGCGPTVLMAYNWCMKYCNTNYGQ